MVNSILKKRQTAGRRVDGGFTLVELLIVVVILGVLATVAMAGYGRWIGRARRSEAIALLAEMTAKQQVYFMEFGAYFPLRADGNSLVQPSPDEALDAFYPMSPSDAAFESARTAVTISNAAAWPVGWRNVGLRPRRQELYCTYLGNAGPAVTAIPAGNTVGRGMIRNPDNPTTPWFYVLAACNLSGPSGFPGNVSIMALTSENSVMRTLNDGR